MNNSLSYVDNFFPYANENDSKEDILKKESEIATGKNEEIHNRLKSLKPQHVLEDMQNAIVQVTRVLQNSEGIESLQHHLKGFGLLFIFVSIILLSIYEFMIN